jgi:hypothetical protein
VKAKKTVLIVTDGSTGIAELAGEIAAVLKGNKISTKTASSFKGNDILPADAFFLGCEKPRPAAFAYLADVLKHINLAGRPCGVFTSGSESAAKYLADLVKDCEAALNPKPLLAGGGGVRNWAQSVVSRSSLGGNND